jgi:hypothetical protein
LARKTVFVSDLSGREIDERDAVTITVKFSDARRGQVVIDGHPEDAAVAELISKGRREGRRGRRPKAAA